MNILNPKQKNIINNQIKAIFFDVGGTLLYPSPIEIGQVIKYVMNKTFSISIVLESVYNISASIDKYYKKIENGSSWWTIMATGIIEWLENVDVDMRGLCYSKNQAFLQYFEQKLKEKHSERNLWHYYLNNTHDVLEYLKGKGYYLAVISNSDGQVRRLLTEAQLDRYFNFIIDSHFVGVEKPNKRIFELGIKASKFKPHEIIYIGDIYSIDVMGAQGSGMQTILLDHLNQRENLNTVRVRSIYELREMF